MTARGPLGSFAIQSYRNQWAGDLLSVWAYEMETLILGWYILVETGSPFALSVVGALRYTGTLLSPGFGVLADQMPRRTLLLAMRAGFALLACALVLSDSAGVLTPWVVFAIAGIGGLVRPSEMVLRQSLIADTVPRALLSNAISLTRTTMDSARIVGALAGAGLLASLGIGTAYLVITAMYCGAIAFTARIDRPVSVPSPQPRQPWNDLKLGIAYIRSEPAISTVMVLAFIANLSAFPLTQGLMPVVARDLYGYDAVGLARMLATAAGGALAGSMLMGTVLRNVAPERMMIINLLIWHALIAAFAFVGSETSAFVLLALMGAVSSCAMIPMTVTLMGRSAPEFRGRVMGVRMLAVYGMPVGLLAGGALIEWSSVRTALAILGATGIAAVLAAALRLRQN